AYKAYKALDQVLETSQDAITIQAELLYGQFRAREGKYDEALKHALSVLTKDGKNAAGLGLRAAIYLEQGNNEQAVIDVRAALNESPRNAKLRRLAARVHDRNGNAELTNESLTTAVVLSAYDPVYVQEYITFLRRFDQHRKIEAILSDAINYYPKDRNLLASLAAARLRLQDWAGAEQAAALLRNLGGVDADRVRVAILEGQQRYGESIELLQQLADQADADGSLMAGLVQVYVKAGRTSEAQAYVTQVLEKDPQNARALRLNGALLELNQDEEGAEKSFRAAILADPLSPTNYLVLGRYLKAKKRPEDSEEILRAGVANVPGNVILHIQLADLLLTRGEFEGALAEFEVVHDLQPDSLGAANNLASMLADFHSENADLVDRAFSIAQRLSSSKNPAHMDTYGWILYLRGDYGRALRSLAPRLSNYRPAPGYSTMPA
ncbi:MAG: tetratricopeptide repeat protein, partial [Alphaproteobacteria bacterium]